MPSPEARTALAEAQKLLAPLRELHDREHALLVKLGSATDGQSADGLRQEIHSLRAVWIDLFDQYSAALRSYTDAVKKARVGP